LSKKHKVLLTKLLIKAHVKNILRGLCFFPTPKKDSVAYFFCEKNLEIGVSIILTLPNLFFIKLRKNI